MDKKQIIARVIEKLAATSFKREDYLNFIKANPPKIETYLDLHFKDAKDDFLDGFYNYLNILSSMGSGSSKIGDVLRKIIDEDITPKDQIYKSVSRHKRDLDLIFGEKYIEIKNKEEPQKKKFILF